MAFDKIEIPAEGDKITLNSDFSLNVPDQPIIPFIEGDGIGIDVTDGRVILATPPAAGATVTAGFAFDVPVRFDTDRIAIDIAGFQAGEAPSLSSGTRLVDWVYVGDVAEGIATITLNRPKSLNAWTARMGAEVKHALAQAEEDKRAVAIILTGAGRGFCAGADLDRLRGISEGRREEELPPELEADPGDPAWGEDLRGTYTYLMSIRKPIIAAVSGYALGGGCELAMMCDFIICSVIFQ